MTNANKTHLGIILDRSGSMADAGKAPEAESGVRALIVEQRELPGDLDISIARFNTRYELLTLATPAAELDDRLINIEPAGGTALFDAVADFTGHLGTHLAALPEDERPGRVIILVATDGEENSSVEFDSEKLRNVLETQQNDYSWEYIFMGTSEAAMLQAQSAGFRGQTSYASSDTGGGLKSAYATASSSISRARTTNSVVEVTDEDRQNLQ